MSPAVILVEPGYGWGWTDGRDTLEAPQPFEAVVESMGDELHGEVRDPGHPYNGCPVVLSRRHIPWDGQVNVEIDGLDLGTVYGYASIPLEHLS
ncbi:MAG TPA: hypothetical protein VGB54_01465 [Allosphingosinicella sp.]